MWSNSCQLDRTWGAVLEAYSKVHTHIYIQIHASIHIHRHVHIHKKKKKYTQVNTCSMCVQMGTYLAAHTNATKKTFHRNDRAGGIVEGGGCWWGWWWLKLDPDRALLASVAPLHKHMLSFGEVFLQTDWLDRSFFFFCKISPCDRALGSNYKPPNSSHWPTSLQYSTCKKQAKTPRVTEQASKKTTL